MARQDFENLTARHLAMDLEDFHKMDDSTKFILCKSYLTHLIEMHGNANRISKKIDMTNRAIYDVMKRYGVEKKREYRAHTRKLKNS
jgi:DNA-binding NtrC family response regulator